MIKPMYGIKKIAVISFLSVFIFPAILFAAEKPFILHTDLIRCPHCPPFKANLDRLVPGWENFVEIAPWATSPDGSAPFLHERGSNQRVADPYKAIQKVKDAYEANNPQQSVVNPSPQLTGNANPTLQSPSPSIPKGAIFIRNFVPVMSGGKITGYDLYDWSDPPKKMTSKPTGTEGTNIIKDRTDGSWLFIYPITTGKDKGNYKVGEYIQSDLSGTLPPLPHSPIKVTAIDLGNGVGEPPKIIPTKDGYELVLHVVLSNGTAQEAPVKVSDVEIAKDIAAAKKRGETKTEEDAVADLLNKKVEAGISQLIKDVNAPKKPQTDTPSPFGPKAEPDKKPATVKPNTPAEVHNPEDDVRRQELEKRIQDMKAKDAAAAQREKELIDRLNKLEGKK